MLAYSKNFFMRPRWTAICGYAVFCMFTAGICRVSLAGEEPASQPPKPTAEELREQLKNLSPAEREAKLKELRERYSRSAPDRETSEKRREELKKLPPAERQAKLREWRQSTGSNAPVVRGFTPAERAAKRKELRARLQERMSQVRTNQLLSAAERKKIFDRMQEVARNFDASLLEGQTQGAAAETNKSQILPLEK